MADGTGCSVLMTRDRVSQGKISIYCAVASGSVAISPLLVALLGWSMVALEDHAIAQLEAGVVLRRLGPVTRDAGWRGFLFGDYDPPIRRLPRPAGAG